MIRATALITAATVGLAASALAEDKGKHRDRDNDVRTNLSEHIDTRLINEQNLTLIHVRITDEDTSPEAPPGENPQDSTTIIFQFFSEELGTLKYDCGQEIGPFVNALQVGERARHAEGDLTGLLGDEFACAEGRVPQSVSVVCNTNGNEQHVEVTSRVLTPEDRTRLQGTDSTVAADCLIEVDGTKYQSTEGTISSGFSRTKVKPLS
jgi:hypothetical protein